MAARCLVVPRKCGLVANAPPPQLHRSSETTGTGSFRFPRRTGVVAYTHALTQTRAVAVTRGRAFGMGRLLYRGCRNVQRLRAGRTVRLIRTASSNRAILSKYEIVGFAVVLAGSCSAETYPVVSCQAWRLWAPRATRHGSPPGSKLGPCVRAGLGRAPRPRARETPPGRSGGVKKCHGKKVKLIPVLEDVAIVDICIGGFWFDLLYFALCVR